MCEETNSLQAEHAHEAINPCEGAAEVSGCVSVGRGCSEEAQKHPRTPMLHHKAGWKGVTLKSQLNALLQFFS